MAIMIAILASKASISLKSLFSNPFTTIHFQFFPALELFPTIPLLPLTHTTLLLITDNPRILVFTPVLSISTFGKAFLCEKTVVVMTREKHKIKNDFPGLFFIETI